MAAAGATLLYPLTDLAVMWFLDVFAHIVTFIRLILQADRHFRDTRPDAVIVVDYPGLHWWIIRRAKARGIPVFYYVPPQLWAWAGWRVAKVRRFVDLVLCSLPFEPSWYRARGVSNVVYVGHPYFDELHERELNQEFLELQRARPEPLVAILPGSRTKEITRNLPILLRAAEKLADRFPHVRFAVACLHDRHKTLAERILQDQSRRRGGGKTAAVEVEAGRTGELIRAATVAWAVSGSVSLELMMEALPTVILYKVNRFDLAIARPFIKARFITLVNLLANAELMPEYLTEHDVSDELAVWARTWLENPPARARAIANLAALRHEVAQPGASTRAAEQIEQWFQRRLRGQQGDSSTYRGLHGRPAASAVDSAAEPRSAPL